MRSAEGGSRRTEGEGLPGRTLGFVEATLPALGSPVPAHPGEDLLWDLRVAGLAAEGLTVEQGAALFGVATVQELYDLSLATAHRTDHDGNGQICVNVTNNPPGQPDYMILRVDDRAAAHDAA